MIVPVYNAERYIADALRSILEQSTPPGEVIVVDDGSDDGTSAVLEQFGDDITVVTQPNCGIARARNAGIAAAGGSLLAFLDADDLMTAGALAARLDRLGARDAPQAVFGRMEQFISPDVDQAQARRFRFLPGPHRIRYFPTMVIHRDAFSLVGRVDPSFHSGADIDWFSRAQFRGLRVGEIDAVVVRRRIHGQNHSLRIGLAKHTELLRVVYAHRQRYGAPQGEGAS